VQTIHTFEESRVNSPYIFARGTKIALINWEIEKIKDLKNQDSAVFYKAVSL